MTNLNDKTTRRKLAEKYQNAETQPEEERLLHDFYKQTEQTLTPEDEDMKLLMDATDRLKGEFVLSDDKADEFDRLMAAKQAGRSRRIPLYWLIPAAAALLFVFLTSRHVPQETAKDAVAIVEHKEEPVVEKKLGAESPATDVRKEESHSVTSNVARKPRKSARRRMKTENDASHQIADLTKAVNFQDEQVASYQLRPAGDAAIVTKTCSDGTSSSFIVYTNDDGDSYQIIPMIEMYD